MPLEDVANRADVFIVNQQKRTRRSARLTTTSTARKAEVLPSGLNFIRPYFNAFRVDPHAD